MAGNVTQKSKIQIKKHHTILPMLDVKAAIWNSSARYILRACTLGGVLCVDEL